MKKFIVGCFCAMLLVACNSEFEEQTVVLAEKMHAESCEAVSTAPDSAGNSKLQITLEGVDIDYFGHPMWVLNSYAAQEFYTQTKTLLVSYDALKIKIQNDAGNATFQSYPIRELEIADSLYLLAESIVTTVSSGLGSMSQFQPMFDTVMPIEAFPQIDQTIAQSQAKNGDQQSICYGGYRRVVLEYMSTPIMQIVVQQRRAAGTDCYVFSFSEQTGLIMSLQLNGSLE